MKIKTFWLFIIMCTIVLCSCGSNDEESPLPQEEEKHVYYVKYEIESSYTTTRMWADYSFFQAFSFTTEKGVQSFDDGKKASHQLEATYGPFKFGTYLVLRASQAKYNHGRILISKDNGPFVIKAESTVYDKDLSLDYVIDY